MTARKLAACAAALALFAASIPALAEENGTITAKNSSGETVGTYTTIDAAVSAAGANGTVELSAGTFEFDGRQSVAAAGVTVKGAGIGQTVVTTSANYQNGSATNKKALFTVTADNVTVQDITFDGGAYGNGISSGTDFNVVRLNSGNGIVLEDVMITGSNRTLMSVGTSTDTAEVTANGLYCEAPYKALPTSLFSDTYADVNVVNGTLTLNSGEVNGLICEDDYGIFVNNTSNHYKLSYRSIIWNRDVTSTLAHFVYSYQNISDSDTSLYINMMTKNDNIPTIESMVDEAVTAPVDKELVSAFIIFIDDAIDSSSGSTKTALESCKTELENALAEDGE